jgi:hypothetical protein
MNQNRENLKNKIIQILITAVISALIASLQAFLTHFINQQAPTPSPEVAGGIGLTLASTYHIIKNRIT